jgi:hypothetical protein
MEMPGWRWMLLVLLWVASVSRHPEWQYWHTDRRCKSAAITVIELSSGGVRNFLPDVVDLHEYLLPLLRMNVFAVVLACGSKYSQRPRDHRRQPVAGRDAIWSLASINAEEVLQLRKDGCTLQSRHALATV